MVFINHSDPLARLVLATGVTVVLASVVLFILTLLLHCSLIIREKRKEKFCSVWRPLLQNCVFEVPAFVPRINASNIYTFLYLWNYLHESLLGDAKQRLNDLARAAKIDQVAVRMLRKRNLRARLLAVVTLGHLKETSVWEELRSLAASDNAFLSLAATSAMIRIDASSALPILAPLIASREDWPRTKVINILKETSTDVFAAPLVEAAASAPAPNAARLIRYLEATRCAPALLLLRAHLKMRPHEDEVVAASLRLFGLFQDPEDLETVRGFVDHTTWFVRLAAVIALGRMGTRQDQARLIERLSDDHWWVRYRAAEALANHPSMSPERMRQIQVAETDPRAQEILVPFLTPTTEGANLLQSVRG